MLRKEGRGQRGRKGKIGKEREEMKEGLYSYSEKNHGQQYYHESLRLCILYDVHQEWNNYRECENFYVK